MRCAAVLYFFLSKTHHEKPQQKRNQENKTRDGGYLGSHIDEERSEMRYVMRIAEHVSHRIFERKWCSRAILRACLFECPHKLLAPYCFFALDLFRGRKRKGAAIGFLICFTAEDPECSAWKMIRGFGFVSSVCINISARLSSAENQC